MNEAAKRDIKKAIRDMLNEMGVGDEFVSWSRDDKSILSHTLYKINGILDGEFSEAPRGKERRNEQDMGS